MTGIWPPGIEDSILLGRPIDWEPRFDPPVPSYAEFVIGVNGHIEGEDRGP